MPTALSTRSRTVSPPVQAKLRFGKHTGDIRMLAQQQLRLLAGIAPLLIRLLHTLQWDELRPTERRRALLLLSRLEHDLALTRVLTRSQPMTGPSLALQGTVRGKGLSSAGCGSTRASGPG